MREAQIGQSTRMGDAPENTCPWFPIRLSTAIILMFVAGGLLGANLWPSTRTVVSVVVVSTADAPTRTLRHFVASQRWCYGWPMTVIEVNAEDPGGPSRSATGQKAREGFAGRGEPGPGTQAAAVQELARRLYLTGPVLADGAMAPLRCSYVAVNLLVALAILAAVAVGLEGRIRRRERQQ